MFANTLPAVQAHSNLHKTTLSCKKAVHHHNSLDARRISAQHREA